MFGIRHRNTGDDGRHVIVLGVSRGNVERLMAGKPIHVTGESVGVPEIASILIFFGETEAAMEAELRDAGVITDTTVTWRRP